MQKINKLKELRNNLNLKIDGESKVPKDEPVIFISNHNCLMDIFYIPASIDINMVSLISSRLIYKKDIKRQDVVLKYLNAFPIEAHGGSIYSKLCLSHASDILCSNIDVCIFPEGAYVYDNGIVHRGRTGAVRILFDCLDRGVKPYLIPVSTKVNGQIKDMDCYEAKHEEVDVHFLDPIDYMEYYYIYKNVDDKSKKNEQLHNVMDNSMKKIAEALDKKYVNEYIELYPKGNVIFENGETVLKEDANSSEYITRYNEELTSKKLKLIDELRRN